MTDNHTPLHESDDELIDRLRALGPVLDQLTEDAARNDPPAGGGTGLRHAPRHRSRGDRRRSLVTAAIAVLLAGALGLAVLGRDDSSSITSDQTTTTTTVADAELAALVSTRIDDVKSCGAATPPDQWQSEWPAGWAQVGSHTCKMGWVEAGAETVRPIPVYASALTADQDPPIAWWSPSTGWIDVAEYDDPDFDLARYRAAYSAELEARGEDPNQIPDDGTYFAGE